MDYQKFKSELSQDVMRKNIENLQIKQLKIVGILWVCLFGLFIVYVIIIGKQDFVDSYAFIAVILWFLLYIKIRHSSFGEIPEPTVDEMKKLAKEILNKVSNDLSDVDKKRPLLEEKTKMKLSELDNQKLLLQEKTKMRLSELDNQKSLLQEKKENIKLFLSPDFGKTE